jgi:hypothetical protein
MSELVLVGRESLGYLLEDLWAVLSGAETPGIITHLAPDDPLVTVAVMAGLPIPGPMCPGTVPPPPPEHQYDHDRVVQLLDKCIEILEARAEVPGELCATTYRAEGDPRLRCAHDGKVVYGSMSSAQSAADLISQREPMKCYLGPCGHYHVSRRNRNGTR